MMVSTASIPVAHRPYHSMERESDQETGMATDQAHGENHSKEEEVGWGNEVEQHCYQSASPSSTQILAGYTVAENCVDFHQVEPEKAVNVKIDWKDLNFTSLVWMVVIKVFDLTFSLYLAGLISYCIYINSFILLGQVITFCIKIIFKCMLINNLMLGFNICDNLK